MTVYYKMRQMLSQNATAILLQNATEIHYKMRQVSITKCDSFITKCDSYDATWMTFNFNILSQSLGA